MKNPGRIIEHVETHEVYIYFLKDQNEPARGVLAYKVQHKKQGKERLCIDEIVIAVDVLTTIIKKKAAKSVIITDMTKYTVIGFID